MARYRPVYTAIWEDDDLFLKYSDSEKVLFFYLITNDKCTESGVYKISTRNMSFILGWNMAKTIKLLDALKPNVYYDKETSCVFVKNFLRYNGLRHGRPDLISISISKDRQNFETCLWDCFLRVYPKFEQTMTKPLRPFLDNDSSSFLNPDLKNKILNSFNAWYLKYPKKVNKGAAERAWKRVSEPADTADKIIKALEWQIKSEKWTKDGGQYIPNPATYINGKGWEDEPIKPKQEKAWTPI